MKIMLLGHSVLDNIVEGQNSTIKAGGLYYTASALNKITSGDEIFLCTSMEQELFSHFEDEYSKCKTTHIQFGSNIPRVNLYINPGKERCEKYENINSSLQIPFTELSSFDAILLNMITGFDISLDQLREIRKYFKGIIYMDVHTLSRGLDENMQRSFRRIPAFNEWKNYVDIIQVNEHEIFTISKEKDELSIARDILLLKDGDLPSQLILTMGELGAKVYNTRDDDIKSFFIAAPEVQLKNTIGLGDTFGAVYFYIYLKTKSIYKALESAIKASAVEAEAHNKTESGQ